MTYTQGIDAPGNQWLANLSLSDIDRLKPHLSHVVFDRGLTLYDAGQDVDQVYFPLEGVVSMMTVLKGGVMVETAVIGREGMVGVTCGPMNGRANSRAVTQTDGSALCMDIERFTQALAQSAEMRQALSRYTEALFAQVQQTAACNALHKLEARLARWLLALQDRYDSPVFDMTQEDLADLLGVRRATVSEVSAALENRGLIQRGRGRVEIVDRKGLEGAACECYRTMRKTLQDLLGSDGA